MTRITAGGYFRQWLVGLPQDDFIRSVVGSHVHGVFIDGAGQLGSHVHGVFIDGAGQLASSAARVRGGLQPGHRTVCSLSNESCPLLSERWIGALREEKTTGVHFASSSLRDLQ
jgi:hypothetical protein